MSKKIAEDLKALFDLAPPEKLKTTLMNLLLENLMRTPKGSPHKTEVYQDLYFLFDFLEKQK